MTNRLLKAAVIVPALMAWVGITKVRAQELNAKVTINHSQIQGTDASVFEEIEQNLTRFINEHQWTSLQFQKNERIPCNFNITVTKYDNSTNVFTCKAVVQANRPVYGSSYTTTLYNNTDNDFNFEYAQFQQLHTATHVELYNRFPNIGGVVHTHSPWATSWAQAGRGIPCYGTTHADYLYGTVPCVRNLTKEEIDEAYEKNTGVLIADRFDEDDLDYVATPAVLCKNHGPFTWGKDAHEAVHNAVVLEEVAKMAARCEMINPDVKPAPQALQDKHYYRKHGANAYYGQPGK